jgi:hypothetical protein
MDDRYRMVPGDMDEPARERIRDRAPDAEGFDDLDEDEAGEE